MAKKTTSFRLADTSMVRIEELTELFRESGGEVVQRAIDFLYENREEQAKLDLEKRLKSINSKK